MKFVRLFPLEDKDAGAGAAGAGSGAGAGTGSGGESAAAGSGGGAGSGAGAGTATTGGGASGAGAAGGASTGAGAAAAGAGAGGAGGAGAGASAGAGAGGAVGASASSEAGVASAAGATTPQWDADHWRETFAGGDAKKKAFAERHTDLKSLTEAAFNANQRIEELSNRAKKVLPENATPEQLTAYRKDNGIPEKPEGYLETLPADIKSTLDDQDKAAVTPYLSLMQKHNLSPAAAAEFVQMRQAEMHQQVDARLALDETLRAQTEETLRKDWGSSYKPEINNIQGLLNGLPADVRNALLDARTPDGNGLFASPETVKAFAQLARQVNPYSIPVGNDGGSLDQKGVESRITEIEGWMGQARTSEVGRKYWDSAKTQAEYRELVTARENMRKRTQAA